MCVHVVYMIINICVQFVRVSIRTCIHMCVCVYINVYMFLRALIYNVTSFSFPIVFFEDTNDPFYIKLLCISFSFFIYIHVDGNR